jgi:hypothetical protein
MNDGEVLSGDSDSRPTTQIGLGFKLGEKGDLQERDAYIVVNSKTDKYLMCLG